MKVISLTKVNELTQAELLIAYNNGIRYHNLHNRLNNLKWDKERAITQPVINKVAKSYKKGVVKA